MEQKYEQALITIEALSTANVALGKKNAELQERLDI